MMENAYTHFHLHLIEKPAPPPRISVFSNQRTYMNARVCSGFSWGKILEIFSECSQLCWWNSLSVRISWRFKEKQYHFPTFSNGALRLVELQTQKWLKLHVALGNTFLKKYLSKDETIRSSFGHCPKVFCHIWVFFWRFLALLFETCSYVGNLRQRNSSVFSYKFLVFFARVCKLEVNQACC